VSDELNSLYTENAKVASVFWDLRHKLLTFFLTAVGALSLASTWAYTNIGDDWRFLIAALPLTGVVVIGVGCIALEHRNNVILGQVYEVGAAIEKEWAKSPDVSTEGIYAAFASTPRGYTRVLRRVFTTISAISAIGVVALVVAFIVVHA
jgi:hypothetical protein